MRHIFIWSLLLVFACAEGSTGETDNGSDVSSSGQGAAGTGGSTSGSGGSSTSGNGGSGGTTSGSGGSGGMGCPSGTTPCGITCVDLQTDSDNCGACGNSCLLGESCIGAMCTGGSSSSSASSTSSSSASSSSASSSSGGNPTCSPGNPGLVCGSNSHCIPQTNGIPLCSGPTGSGTQYTSCNTNATCAPPYECVNTGFFTVYCMHWCMNDLDCPGWPFDTCYGLGPAVFVGSQEWGVCWDGLP
jgi:hypothetical protein